MLLRKLVILTQEGSPQKCSVFLTIMFHLNQKKLYFSTMQFQEGYHTYYIYIITNKAKTVLYIGVTNHLKVRLLQHKDNVMLGNKTFASKYNVHYLLYYEKFTWIQEAIAREKEVKGWRREKKLELIKTMNPNLEILNYLFE
jgi:putative endonuclease